MSGSSAWQVWEGNLWWPVAKLAHGLLTVSKPPILGSMILSHTLLVVSRSPPESDSFILAHTRKSPDVQVWSGSPKSNSRSSITHRAWSHEFPVFCPIIVFWWGHPNPPRLIIRHPPIRSKCSLQLPIVQYLFPFLLWSNPLVILTIHWFYSLCDLYLYIYIYDR